MTLARAPFGLTPRALCLLGFPFTENVVLQLRTLQFTQLKFLCETQNNKITGHVVTQDYMKQMIRVLLLIIACRFQPV